jgi:hypothetical protein
MDVMLSLAEADEVINRLLARPEPLIVQLPRQSGRREVRFAHLLAGEPVIEEGVETAIPREERLIGLEDEVQRLRRELDELREQFDAFGRQFE